MIFEAKLVETKFKFTFSISKKSEKYYSIISYRCKHILISWRRQHEKSRWLTLSVRTWHLQGFAVGYSLLYSTITTCVLQCARTNQWFGMNCGFTFSTVATTCILPFAYPNKHVFRSTVATTRILPFAYPTKHVFRSTVATTCILPFAYPTKHAFRWTDLPFSAQTNAHSSKGGNRAIYHHIFARVNNYAFGRMIRTVLVKNSYTLWLARKPARLYFSHP